jgi:hypothetical protein
VKKFQKWPPACARGKSDVEAHNTWVANQPGTMLVIPVADVAQYVLPGLCYLRRTATSFISRQNLHRISRSLSGGRCPGLLDHLTLDGFLRLTAFAELHFQFRISGMSSPYWRM